MRQEPQGMANVPWNHSTQLRTADADYPRLKGFGRAVHTDNNRHTPLRELLWTAMDQEDYDQCLLHHAHIVQISGDSYRLKDKRKAGTLRAPKAS